MGRERKKKGDEPPIYKSAEKKRRKVNTAEKNRTPVGGEEKKWVMFS